MPDRGDEHPGDGPHQRSVEDSDRSAKARYSPGECTGTHVIHVSGRPDITKISTSYVERNNLNVRMSVRRYTRLTNAFSKKLENHTAAFSLYAMHHNWCRPHKSLKGRTPAQAAGLTTQRMTVADIVRMVDAAYEAVRPKARGGHSPGRPLPGVTLCAMPVANSSHQIPLHPA